MRALLLVTALLVGCGAVDDSGRAAWPAPCSRDLTATVDLNRKIKAGFLIVDGVYNSELMAPYDIFQHTIFHTDPYPGIEVFTVSPDGQPVRSFEGLTIGAHYSFETAPAIDILVIPSAEGSMDTDLQNEAMMAWVMSAIVAPTTRITT